MSDEMPKRGMGDTDHSQTTVDRPTQTTNSGGQVPDILTEVRT